MSRTILEHPLLIFAVSFVALWASTLAGVACARRRQPPKAETHETFKVVMAATLTLLGLVVGFSFSMAVTRYDQRKIHEEDEANAIGTEFLRVDLLPSRTAEARDLLREYLAQRVAFYQERDDRRLAAISARTATLQHRMWAVVRDVAAAQSTPAIALAVTGMNDVLNSEGYTHAAWANRIPDGAWLLMAVIGILSCALSGYTAREARPLLMLSVILSVAFFFIGDIDSPRHGVIRVVPQNLIGLAASMSGG